MGEPTNINAKPVTTMHGFSGYDGGFDVKTVTVICDKCDVLDDVTRLRRVNGKWLKIKKHTVHLWFEGGPCPKCGGKMLWLGVNNLWD